MSYYLSDSLGSSRVVTDSSGNILDDCDFQPYGSEVCAASSSGNHYLFTGLERDSESGLDHTLNRQYASNYGRWLSPDPGGTKVVKLEDPQTWNLYSYVRDNPLTLADPTGLQGGCTNQSTGCTAQNQSQTQTTEITESVETGVNDTKIIRQEKTVTTITSDDQGNPIGKTVTRTVTTAIFSLAGDEPKFLKGYASDPDTLLGHAIGQDEAEKALGGAEHTSDVLAGIIKTQADVKFGTILASGAIGGTEIAGELTAGKIGGAVWGAVKEAIVHNLIDKILP